MPTQSQWKKTAGQLTPHTPRRRGPLKCFHQWKQYACELETSPQQQPSSLHPCSRSGWTWPSACTWTLLKQTHKSSKGHIIQAKNGWFPCYVDAEGSWESSWCGRQQQKQQKCDRCLIYSQGRCAARGNLRTDSTVQKCRAGHWITVTYLSLFHMKQK